MNAKLLKTTICWFFFKDMAKASCCIPKGSTLGKKGHVGKIKIRIEGNWGDSTFIREQMNRYTKGTYCWNKIYICNADETPDLFVVINLPLGKIDFSKTILFQLEPSSIRDYWGPFWSNPPREYFIECRDLDSHPPCVIWSLNRDYDFLIRTPIVKTKIMSGVISDSCYLPGHLHRLNFIRYYLDNLPYYEHFGKKTLTTGILDGLKTYHGELKNKEDGLFPYRYTFNCENSYERNYFTEKLIDAILAECLCFYDGCPNLSDFFDDRCFIKLDLRDPSKSFQIIKDAIENNEWKKRIDIIRDEKSRILNDIQIMPMIEQVLEDKGYTVNHN